MLTHLLTPAPHAFPQDYPQYNGMPKTLGVQIPDQALPIFVASAPSSVRLLRHLGHKF